MGARRPWNSGSWNSDSRSAQSWDRNTPDDEAQSRALAIARRSGLSLNAWLNAVVSDANERAGAPPRDFGDDKAHTRHTPRRHSQSGQTNASHRPKERHNARLSKMFRHLAELTERVAAAEEQAQRALALAEARLAAADRAGTISPRHVSAFEEEVDHVHAGLAAVEREARRSVRELAGETQALGRVAEHDDPRLDTIASAIRSIEGRLDTIGERLSTPAREAVFPIHDERLAKIEGQLADIAQQLHEPAPASPYHDDLLETVRQIAQRQRHLDDERLSPTIEPRSAPLMSDSGSLRDIHARLSELAEQISIGQRPAPLDERLNDLPEHFESLRRSVEGASSEPSIDRLLAEVRQLGGKISEARRDGIDAESLKRLEMQIQDIRAAMDHERFGDVITQIKMINDKLDRPLDQRLNELPERFESLRRSVEGASREPSFDRLLAEVRQLGAKIGEARRDGIDAESLKRLEMHIQDIRAALDHGRFSDVITQINMISDKLDRPQPREDIAAIDRLRDDISNLRVQMSANQREAHAEAPTAHADFDLLRHRIDQIQSLLAAQSDTPLAIRNLAERIDTLATQLLATDTSGPTHRMIEEVRARVDDLASRPPAPIAFKDVEQRLLSLVEKIEQTPVNAPPSDHLKTVDTRLQRLTELMESQQATPRPFEQIQEDLRQAVSRLDDAALRDKAPQPDPSSHALERHIADFRRAAEGSDKRITETLSAVHDALARLADRLGPAGAATAPIDAWHEPKSTAATASMPKQAAMKPGAAMPAAAAARRGVDQASTMASSPAPTPERSPLSAAREAAAQAAELEKLQKERGEIDLPLEPGSGRPGNGAPMRMSAPISASDPVRVARAAMLQQSDSPKLPSKVGMLRTAFINIVRRTKTMDPNQGSTPTLEKESDTNPPQKGGRIGRKIAPQLANLMTESGPLDRVASASKLPRPGKVSSPTNLRSMAVKVAVAASIVAIIAGGLQIVLSIGEPTPAPAPTQSNRERPLNGLASQPAEASGSNSTLLDPSQSGQKEIDKDKRSDAGGGAEGASASIAAGPNIPPLPEGVNSQRLKQALEQQNPRAFFDVGVRLADGRQIPRDVEAAIPWFRLAAEKGHAPAYYRLGNVFEKGLGPKRDLNEAISAYKKGAELGNRKSMHNLATLYASGVASGTPDYDRAVPLFEQAAELDLVDSQFNLAVLLVNGLGTKVNLSEAYKWFSIAAKNGDKEAGKKRDEIAAKLSGQVLVDARLAAQNYRPKALAASANEDVPPSLLFEDNPLANPTSNGVPTSSNLGISVAPAGRRS